MGRDGEPSLHRNNAAEWVMYVGVLPVIGVVRLFSFVASYLGGKN
jgi:hypothetical protein